MLAGALALHDAYETAKSSTSRQPLERILEVWALEGKMPALAELIATWHHAHRGLNRWLGALDDRGTSPEALHLFDADEKALHAILSYPPRSLEEAMDKADFLAGKAWLREGSLIRDIEILLLLNSTIAMFEAPATRKLNRSQAADLARRIFKRLRPR